jgi:hypothetical protein
LTLIFPQRPVFPRPTSIHTTLEQASRSKMRRTFLTLCLVSCPASSSALLPYSGARPTTHHGLASCKRSSRVVILANDDDELAAQFAAEQRRRKQQPSSGIREVVLDQNGQPISIPRRSAPTPAEPQRFSPSGLIFGGLLTAGSLALLLAISAADSAASS